MPEMQAKKVGLSCRLPKTARRFAAPGGAIYQFRLMCLKHFQRSVICGAPGVRIAWSSRARQLTVVADKSVRRVTGVCGFS